MAQDARRFISTCVETITPRPERRQSRPVHLHVRGDHSASSYSSPSASGSSPRAWRPCNDKPPCRVVHRFISTCVETISAEAAHWPPPQVHLHVRGDHSDYRHHSVIAVHSRAWGKLHQRRSVKGSSHVRGDHLKCN